MWVRNAGSTAPYDAWTGLDNRQVTAVAPIVISLTADKLFPVATGTPVTWTAAAAGGNTPLEYAFFLYQDGIGYTQVQMYSSQRTWTWTPSQPATYGVQVWVRAVGSPNNQDAWRFSGYFDVSNTAQPSVSLSANQPYPLPVLAPITWTAQASGGSAPLQYKFFLYDSHTNTWPIIQNWSANNQFTWTPTLSDYGARVVQVWLRSTGSTAAYDAWTTTGYFFVVR